MEFSGHGFKSDLDQLSIATSNIYIYTYIHIDTNKYQQCNKRAQYNCRAIIVYNYCTIIIIL